MATIAKINGIDIANITAINGISKASIAKFMGLDLPSSSSGLIDSYGEDNQSDWSSIADGINGGIAGQAIVLADAADITSIKFYLKGRNSPSGDVKAAIYACTGTPGTDGKSTGSALAESAAVEAETISTSFELVEFTFSTPYEASTGNICIVATYNGASGYIDVGNDSSSPTHDGNHFRGTNAYDYMDTCFYLYGN